MSSSTHARKFMKTISKFQKIGLQNKSAYEGPETKNFSWFPFGWSRASYQENFDGLNDTFNSTGIVADSIFMYANPEAACLQQENVLLSSKSKCPAQRMLDQQTSHSHPKLKDLYRRRCGLPIDANEVKDPLTDEQKKFIEKLKRCPNSPPTLDQFQATTQQGYSHVNANVSFPGNAEMVSELPYWVKADAGDAVKSRLPSEGAINLRSPQAYLAEVVEANAEKHAQDCAYKLPGLSWTKEEKSKNVTNALPEVSDFESHSPTAYGALVDIDINPCQIDNTSSLSSQNVLHSSAKLTSSKLIRFFSSTTKKSKSEKEKCQKLPSTVPPPSSQGKCTKVKAAGCGSRARENCNPIIKERAPCEKLEPPYASYSECLKDPTPPANMTECPRKDNGPPAHCLKPNEGLSIDGCNPPGPKELGQCLPRKRAPPRSNACNEKKGGCDPSIKPFKNAATLAPSPISCPSPSMSYRISEPGASSSSFSTPKRYYSSKGSSGKPPKSKTKDGKNKDWLKSKSPNECKKRKGKCDPNIKPFKNSAPPPPPPQPIRRHSAPIITRVANSGDLVTPHNPPKRFFSVAKKEVKDETPKKPCFEPKKIKPKEGLKEEDMHSPVSCKKKPDDISGNRCERAKCGPSSIDCKKPPPINQHKCPKKPKQGKRKKKVRVVAGPKLLLGYKVCNKPPRARPYQCKPKEERVVKKAVVPPPTAKRCPCFAPMDFDQQMGGSTCRKVRNAVEPNCNKPSIKDGEPKGKCEKKEGCKG